VCSGVRDAVRASDTSAPPPRGPIIDLRKGARPPISVCAMAGALGCSLFPTLRSSLRARHVHRIGECFCVAGCVASHAVERCAAAGRAVLNPVESQRAIAVLEETVERLKFLGTYVLARETRVLCGASARHVARGAGC
jgi:hypothetical protein